MAALTRGPIPKDAALRQRRNKASTRATLVDDGAQRIVPRLPKREVGQKWHALTRRWWTAIFRSPMAAEYLAADIQGLYRLAVIVDMFWLRPSVKVASVIGTLETKYGLSPIDRRRLEWIVEHAEAEKVKPKSSNSGSDPRGFLKVVGE